MRKTPAIALVAILGVVLTGCVQSTPAVIPTSQPASKPVFATDAEALAAAKKAYVAYSAASDKVLNDGGRTVDLIRPFVTAKWYPTELKGYTAFAKTGNRFVGSSAFTTFRLQQQETEVDRIASVDVYVCVDVSKARLINSKGEDITSPTRKDIYPILTKYESKTPGSSQLLFAGSYPWSGTNFC